MPVSIHDLQYFRAIVEHKTLSAAGAAIGISQPALSKCLKRLERAYGGPMLEWREGRAHLSEIGRVVHRNADDILFRVADVGRQIRTVAEGDEADVRVGAGPYVAEAAGKQAIARFIREHPHSCASMTIAPWDRLTRLLYQEHLAFFIADIGDTILSGDLEVTELARQPVVWFCRSGHPLAVRRKAITLQELTEYPICGPELPTRIMKWLVDVKRLGAGPNQAAPDRALSIMCDDWGKLRYIVEHSGCITLSPLNSIRADLDTGKLALIDAEHEPLVARFGAVRVKSASPSEASKRLLDYFVEELQRD